MDDSEFHWLTLGDSLLVQSPVLPVICASPMLGLTNRDCATNAQAVAG
jgi:hypothetical protein